jgi:hypothetical protein
MANQIIPCNACDPPSRSEQSGQRRRMNSPIAFMRGGHLFQIFRSQDGREYVGYRDGRVVGRAAERGEVARGLLSFALDQDA